MTDVQRRMAELLGLKEQDFQPQENNDKQRIDALETTTDDIILMMAELIGGTE